MILPNGLQIPTRYCDTYGALEVGWEGGCNKILLGTKTHSPNQLPSHHSILLAMSVHHLIDEVEAI